MIPARPLVVLCALLLLLGLGSAFLPALAAAWWPTVGVVAALAAIDALSGWLTPSPEVERLAELFRERDFRIAITQQ